MVTRPGTTLTLPGSVTMRPGVGDGAVDLARQLIDEQDHLGRRQRGIAPVRHRRRAGVVRLAGQHEFAPPDRLHAGHRADAAAFGVEDRPLLDVQFQIGVRLQEPGLGRADVADAVQFLADRFAVACRASA